MDPAHAHGDTPPAPKVVHVEASLNEPYYLGIDIGTTTVKICIMDASERCVKSTMSSAYSQINNSALADGHVEQNTMEILESIDKCMLKLPAQLLAKVTRIGICGQMHGVCLWKYHSENRSMSCSNLVTWMDQRCDRAFLASLPKPESHLTLNSGYGCATLFWLQRFKPEELDQYDSAGTIMDFLVTILCDLPRPIMSPQNAASWGYFDCTTNTFNLSILEASGFPVRFLPKVVNPETTSVGKVKVAWNGIKAGTAVAVALGDLQCSVYAAISSASKPCGFVNISTSAQIAHVTSTIDKSKRGIEYFPFFDQKYLAVGASLNGGNVLATFVQSVQNLLEVFGQQVPNDLIWDRLLVAGNTVDSTTLTISPLLFGERHSPEERATIRNLSVANHSIGHIVRSLCRGLIQNLTEFVTPKDFLEAGIVSIIATGSALLRNNILQQELISTYDLLNIIFTTDNESGSEFGAAKFARSLDNRPNYESALN